MHRYQVLFFLLCCYLFGFEINFVEKKRMLAEKLNMENDQAEKWIVDLIRNARLDAKIDSAQGHIIMGSHNPTVYVLLFFFNIMAKYVY